MTRPGSALIVGRYVMGPYGTIERGSVSVEDGFIVEVGESSEVSAPSDAELVEADELIVAPGLIDIQINGGFGHDFTNEPESIWEVGARLPTFGVTSFVPTVVTSTAEARVAMLDVLAAGAPADYRGATALGVHFEGPFISPQASGAHDRALLRLPRDADPDVARWSRDAGVLMATIAPELDGALDLVRALAAKGVVVSAGHSAATRDQAVAGFDAGVTYATHLFNAMPPLGHREPGLAGAALVDPRVTSGLIADGIHVHPDVINIAVNSTWSERLSLVTDATAALGMPVGHFVLGGRALVLDGTSVRLAEDGRLAGSALAADEALRRFYSFTGWAPEAVILTMTKVPSKLLGLKDRGELRPGRRADLTLFDVDLNVVGTYIAGERWA